MRRIPMFRTALLAIVLGIGTPDLGGFIDLFISDWAPDAVEIGPGWDPWGEGDGAESGDQNGDEDLGPGIDPWGSQSQQET
jgi:hypothetical protein